MCCDVSDSVVYVVCRYPYHSTQKNSSTSEGMVNDLLKEEMSSSIHALSIQAKTPKQWEESKGAVADTPGCIRPAHVPMK